MYKRVLIALVAIVMLAGFAAGCGGGGGDQGGGQEQGANTGQPDQKNAEQGKTKKEKKARTSNVKEVKALRGVVGNVDTERNIIVVKPPEEKAVLFRYRPDNVKVMLEGNEAEVQDIEKGQQATISYVVIRPPKQDKDRNVIRLIEVEPRGAQTGGGATN